MFKRKLENKLDSWKVNPNRKPLIIRGARQVGKSTLIRHFGLKFKYFINLNLERPNDKKYFEKEREVSEILEQILFEKNIPNAPSDTLLFIDEIQENPNVIHLLRYFYEDLPNLHVIAAGSLLEFSLKEISNFPVGRIEEMTLHPFDFEEFLWAIDEENAAKQLNKIPFDDFAFDKLLQLFKRYMIIGGMPEVVKVYVESNRSIVDLKPIYASIWNTYKSDVIKYAKNSTEAKVLRHIIETAPFVRDRITFANFGGSNYRSREVGEAFRALELAKIIYLIYPTTQTAPPQLSDLSRKPRLQFLDTGLMNFASEIQAELLQLDNFNDYYKGFLVNHIVTQELISSDYKPQFWVKENANLSAEVDLTYKKNNLLIPIEVKSGAKGSLRSLHEYMDLVQHRLAIRFLGNKVSIEEVKTRNGKPFSLLNLPYFIVSKIENYIDFGLKEVS